MIHDRLEDLLLRFEAACTEDPIHGGLDAATLGHPRSSCRRPGLATLRHPVRRLGRSRGGGGGGGGSGGGYLLVAVEPLVAQPAGLDLRGSGRRLGRAAWLGTPCRSWLAWLRRRRLSSCSGRSSLRRCGRWLCTSRRLGRRLPSGALLSDAGSLPCGLQRTGRGKRCSTSCIHLCEGSAVFSGRNSLGLSL